MTPRRLATLWLSIKLSMDAGWWQRSVSAIMSSSGTPIRWSLIWSASGRGVPILQMVLHSNLRNFPSSWTTFVPLFLLSIMRTSIWQPITKIWKLWFGFSGANVKSMATMNSLSTIKMPFWKCLHVLAAWVSISYPATNSMKPAFFSLTCLPLSKNGSSLG